MRIRSVTAVPISFRVPQGQNVTLGIGRAGKGTMSGRVLLPLRTDSGKLLGYVGISPKLTPVIKLPTKWRL